MTTKENQEFRHRLYKPLLGKPMLVLQVKVQWEDGPLDFHGLPQYLAGEGWRDAEVEDFLKGQQP